MFVYSNYLYVNDRRCQVYAWCVYAKANICNVYKNKGKEVGWVIHLLSQFYILSLL